jgi:hypothetical protein
VYLNEVIDQWFTENFGVIKNTMVRYADDGAPRVQKEFEYVIDLNKLCA